MIVFACNSILTVLQIEKIRQESRKLSVKYRQGDKSMQQLIESIGEMAEGLDVPKRELQEKQQQEESRLSRMEDLRHDIDKLKEELDNLPPLVDIKPSLNKLLKEMSEIEMRIRNIQVVLSTTSFSHFHYIKPAIPNLFKPWTPYSNFQTFCGPPPIDRNTKFEILCTPYCRLWTPGWEPLY